MMPEQPPPLSQANLIARAHRAIATLESRRKALNREHVERIKRLRLAIDSLVSAEIDYDGLDVGQPVLAPELVALIDSPESGL